MPHTSRETLQLTILQPYNQHENPRFDKINLAVSCKISNFVIAFEPLHQGGCLLHAFHANNASLFHRKKRKSMRAKQNGTLQ